MKTCHACRWCGPLRLGGKILCNHASWGHWDEEMRIFEPDFAPECFCFSAKTKLHDGEFCNICNGQTMIPSMEPDGDIMNTPCPECNERSDALYRVEYYTGANCWLVWKDQMRLAAAQELAQSIDTRDTRIVLDKPKMKGATATTKP